MRSQYHYLNELGELDGFKKNNLLLEKKTFLVLDSSVCLDIINIINKKNINKESKRKAFELIKYSKKKGISTFVILALLELSLDKSTYNLNTDKFIDLNNKLKFAFNFPLERLKKNDFNFLTNFYQSEKPTINQNASSIVEQILVHYSALLKIREIACRGLSKQKSKKNIVEFIDWMYSELNLILGLEYQLAFQIFGGNNSFNTMIKENSNKENALKALWGTAWDFLHARVSRNSKQLSKIVNEDVNSIFITNDKRLYELLAPQVKFATKFGRSRISITDGNKNYPPYFDDVFVKNLNTKIIRMYDKRILSNITFPSKKSIENIISNLEKNVT